MFYALWGGSSWVPRGGQTRAGRGRQIGGKEIRDGRLQVRSITRAFCDVPVSGDMASQRSTGAVPGARAGHCQQPGGFLEPRPVTGGPGAVLGATESHRKFRVSACRHGQLTEVLGLGPEAKARHCKLRVAGEAEDESVEELGTGSYVFTVGSLDYPTHCRSCCI